MANYELLVKMIYFMGLCSPIDRQELSAVGEKETKKNKKY